MEKIPNNNEQERLLSYKEKFRDIVSSDALDHEKLDQIMSDIRVRVSDLKIKYGSQIYENAWYHMLVGSSPIPGRAISYVDFEGEDSIASFIDSLQV